MRKFLVAAALTAAFGSAGAFASALDFGTPAVTGDIHAASGYQFRGADFAKNAPSIGGSVQASFQNGVFVGGSVDTISLLKDKTDGNRNFQGLVAAKVGYQTTVSDVNLAAGIAQYDILGSAELRNRAFTEVFAQAEYKGASLKVFRNVAGAANPDAGLSRRDIYAEVGYTYPVGKFSVGADVGYSWYGPTHGNEGTRDGFSLAQVRVGYDVNKDLNVQLTHQLAQAKDAYGDHASANNQTYLGATYKF